MEIRLFKREDLKDLKAMIHKTISGSMSDTYTQEFIDSLIEGFSDERIINQARDGHTWLVLKDNKPLGCASILPFWGSVDKSIILSVFVDQGYQGQGIGRMLIETIKKDPIYKGAKTVTLTSSVKAVNFYKTFGFELRDGSAVPDEKGEIWMEISK